MAKKKTGKRHNAKKYKKRTPYTRRLKMGIANDPTIQRINSLGWKSYFYKSTFELTTHTGASVSVTGLRQFYIGQVPQFAQLSELYRQYKIHSITLRFTLRNVENTDGNAMPKLYIRYNYDPNLSSGTILEAYMLKLTNTVIKTFQSNSQKGITFTYKIKPCVMQALQFYNTTDFKPSPKFNQWCDFLDSGTATDEIGHYGVQYFIPDLPTG